MSEPEVVSAARIYSRLMAGEWGTVCMTQGGHTSVIALICPLCGGHVATGAPPQGITFRDSHARYHRDVLTRIDKLEKR